MEVGTGARPPPVPVPLWRRISCYLWPFVLLAVLLPTSILYFQHNSDFSNGASPGPGGFATDGWGVAGSGPSGSYHSAYAGPVTPCPAWSYEITKSMETDADFPLLSTRTGDLLVVDVSPLSSTSLRAQPVAAAPDEPLLQFR